MKVTVFIVALCAVALALGMLLPTPQGSQAKASPDYPTLQAGRR